MRLLSLTTLWNTRKAMLVPKGIRFVAVLSVVGGIAGIAISLWAEALAYNPAHSVFAATATILFGWSVWVGVRLWQGKPNSYRWAQLLFMLQIPNIAVRGFSYQFYVGLMLGLAFNKGADSKLNLEFELASRLNFQISPGTDNLILGVNLAALAILICLFIKSREEIPTKPAAEP